MRHLFTASLILAAGSAMADTATVTTNVWADNWFAMSVNGIEVLEDSVSITTERSFNQETATFTAELPMTVAITAKDFKENDSGLEYIGTRRQQMGDGGIIAQFKDATTGATLGVTNADWRCIVVHHAPVDKTCESEASPVAGEGVCDFEISDTPSDWTKADFDDSAWPSATEHSASAVDPKMGYDEITWDSDAELIWGPDLEQDNTILCRATIGG